MPVDQGVCEGPLQAGGSSVVCATRVARAGALTASRRHRPVRQDQPPGEQWRLAWTSPGACSSELMVSAWPTRAPTT